MNITLFKKYGDLFASDTLHSYWVTPIEDASGLFSNWKDFSEAELKNLKFDLNPTTISIPNNEITNGTGMFRNNKLIRSVDIDFPNMTDITWMFAGSGLEEITADFSSVTDKNGGIFAQCEKLRTVRCDFRNLANRVMDESTGTNDYSFAFSHCRELETVECNFSSLINGNYLFSDCFKLKNFNCELDSLTSGNEMFTNANLTVESVKNIAEKIKSHPMEESSSHIITLGIKVNDENAYEDNYTLSNLMSSDYGQYLTALTNKGWKWKTKIHGLKKYTYTLNDPDIVSNLLMLESSSGESYLKENNGGDNIYAFRLSKSHFIGADETRQIKRIILPNDGDGNNWSKPTSPAWMALRFTKENTIVGENVYWSNNTTGFNTTSKHYMFNFENLNLPTDYDTIHITLVSSNLDKNTVQFDNNLFYPIDNRYVFRILRIKTINGSVVSHPEGSCKCGIFWGSNTSEVDGSVETIVQLD